MLDQVIHPTDCMRFFMGQVSEVFATGTVDAASSTVSMSVNLRYENGGIGTMTLGTGPVLEAMVFVKGTGNQAIQVLETRELRRYRSPTWLGFGGVMQIRRLKRGTSTPHITASADRLSRRDATLGKVAAIRDAAAFKP